MNKLLIFALFFIFISSCSELMPGNGCFVVGEVREEKNQSTYQLVQSKGKGQTWIVCEVGKYHIGDTVCIQSIR